MNNAEYVLPDVFRILNCFVAPELIRHFTQAESTPILSVTFAVTATGHAVFAVFPIGV